MVHEQDRYELQQQIIKALQDHESFESEHRVKNINGEYHWYRTIGHYNHDDQQLSGIIIDIHKNKMAEQQIKELDQQILTTARRAGMAEVATSILHNIGNILNSSNISVSLLKKSISGPYQMKLLKITKLLNQHTADMADFLTKDSKGQLIPQYLLKLAPIIEQEQQINIMEIDTLVQNMDHIQSIVTMQQSVSGVSNINEKIFIPEILETVLTMTMRFSRKVSIKFLKEYDDCPLIEVDKSKLLQILINLVQNAIDAVILNVSNPVKEIKFILKEPIDNKITLRIEDNGTGIAPKTSIKFLGLDLQPKKLAMALVYIAQFYLHRKWAVRLKQKV